MGSSKLNALVVMAGLPASGKSTLARKLRAPLNAKLYDKDEVRAYIFGEHVDYSREQDDVCLDIIYLATQQLLEKNTSLNVILDGRSYSRSYQVEAIQELSKQTQTPLVMIECRCSEASARHRLLADKESHPAVNRNFELYQHSRAHAEPIPEPKLLLDTDAQTPDGCLPSCLKYIQKVTGQVF